MINQEQAHLLDTHFGKHKDLLHNLATKNTGKKLPKRYSIQLRKFAVTKFLFTQSVPTNSFVENLILSFLVLVRLVSGNVDAEPGFTKEALNTLTLACKNCPCPIYCALSIDEIAIRKCLEFDGRKY